MHTFPNIYCPADHCSSAVPVTESNGIWVRSHIRFPDGHSPILGKPQGMHDGCFGPGWERISAAYAAELLARADDG